MRENAHITIAVTPQEWLTLLEALKHEAQRRLTLKKDGRTNPGSRRRHLAGQRRYIREHIEPLRKYINDALLED